VTRLSGVRSILASQVLFSAAAFATTVLAARALGVEGRGELALMILVPTLVIAALEFGQEFAGSHAGARAPSTRPQLNANAMVYAVVAALPIGLVLAAILLYVAVPTTASVMVAVIAACGVAGGVYLRAAAGLLLGAGRVRAYTSSRCTLSLSFLVIVTGLAVKSVDDPRPYLAAWSVSQVLTAVLLATLLRREIGRPRWAEGRKMAALAGPIHIANIGHVLLLRIDQLLLGALVGAGVVGYYAVAVNVVEIAWYLPAAFGLAALPFLSDQSVELEDKRRALVSAFVRSGAVSLGTVAVLCATAHLLIPVVFGQAFAPATTVLFFLAPGAVAASVIRIAWAALIAAGRTRSLIWAVSTGLAINVALNVAFIPLWEARGAAIASSLSYCYLGARLLRASYHTWGLELGRIPRLRSVESV
jgi:O-antigen/teichoic acid export membrane protein